MYATTESVLYAQLVFGLFKRLHNNADFHSVCIRLAVCQKIVERYCGRIRVES